MKNHNVTSMMHTIVSMIILVIMAFFGSAAKAAPAVSVSSKTSTPKLSLGSYDRHNQWAWQPVKIGAGGFIRGMVIHPANSNIRYARADTWGAYRWDAIHATWLPMITTQNFDPSVKVASSGDPSQTFQLTSVPNGAGVDSIAIDPQDPTRVYVAMGLTAADDITGGANPRAGNVYYSRNSGKSFAASTGLKLLPQFCTNPPSNGPYARDSELGAANDTGERLRVDPRNSNILYMGSEINGAYVSADAGLSFQAISGPGLPDACHAITNVLFDSAATVQRTINGRTQTVSKNLYIIVNYDKGGNNYFGNVYQSTDGGVSWNDITPANSNAALHVSNHKINQTVVDQAGTLWLVSNDGTLLKYQNSAWIVTQPPHAAQDVAIDPNNSLRIFTTDLFYNASRSLDGGIHWTDLGGILSLTSADNISWITARKTRPFAHATFLFDTSIPTAGGKGRLWISNGNDGAIYTDLNDKLQTGGAHGLNWFERSRGIEQLVGQNIVLPSGNKNSAVLAAEDEATFYISNPRLFNAKRYDINTASKGNNDLVTNGMVAFIPDTPSVMVTNPANLFGLGYHGGPYKNNFPGYTVNYGQNWQLFPSIQMSDGINPDGSTGSVFNTPEYLVGGQIAISARGTVFPHRGEAIWTGQDNLVWLPFGNNNGVFALNNLAPQYSFDGAATWQSGAIFDENGKPLPFNCVPKPIPPATEDANCLAFPFIFNSASKQFAVVADPVTPKTFYAVTLSSFIRTVDGGKNWNIPQGTGIYFLYKNFFINAKLTAVPMRSGDLWLATGPGSPNTAGVLYHSVDGGNHWQQLTLAKAYNVAVGKGAPGKDYALYIYGQPDSSKAYGVYRSDDHGGTWYLISGDGTNSFPDHNFNQPSDIAASPDVEGLVYISLNGASALWGYQKNLGNPYPAQ